jgi:exosome complex RNA-binding protein Rrp42 (RNase PH superfamily)
MQEELCQAARLTVAVNRRGHTVAMSKAGRGGLLPSSMSQMVVAARTIGKQIIATLDAALLREASANQPKIGFFASKH